MSFALLICILLLSAFLGLVSCVQLLYLETVRLRPRELPSMQYFKTTLEDRIGLKTEEGGLSFSLLKHSSLLLLGILYYVWFELGATHRWQAVAEAGAASWVSMVTFAYAIPQLTYRRTSAEWLVPLVPLLKVLALIAKPVEALLEFFHSLIDLADEKGGEEQPPTSAENIEALISAGTEEGLIQEDDRKLIQSVVEFGDKVVREVMTPRPNIVAVPADAPLEQLRQLVINEQFSRVPAYEVSIDQIAGFVHVRDMFELGEEQRASKTVRELLRPLRFVPETKPVHDLLRDMQQDGTHMVIVVDEYGNTAGLATMEDLVEVILGEIRDEHEPDSDVVDDNRGGYIVSGSFDVSRVSDLLEFRPGEDIESSTVGGLVTEWLGHVPRAGEVVERHGIRIEVLASDDLRVEQVRISKMVPVPHE